MDPAGLHALINVVPSNNDLLKNHPTLPVRTVGGIPMLDGFSIANMLILFNKSIVVVWSETSNTNGKYEFLGFKLLENQ